MEFSQLESLFSTKMISLLVPLFASIIFIYAISKFQSYWLGPSRSPLSKLQGPPTKHWFFGFMNSTEAQTLQMSPLLLKYCAKFNGVWAAPFTNRRQTLVLGDVVGIHHVLNNSQTFTRAAAQMRTTRLVFGDGLVAVDGEQHRRQRRAIGPGFSSAAINGMMPDFRDSTEKLAARWRERYQSIPSKAVGLEINAYADFEKLFMDIIGESGFQYKFNSLDGHRTELEAAFVNVTQQAATGSLYSVLRSQFPIVETLGNWFVPEQITLNKLRGNIQKVSMQLVDNAKAHFAANGWDKGGSNKRKDILGLLVQSNLQEDAKHRLSDDEIVSIIPTLLSGGYDNNASAMSYALLAMAQTPSTQERLREELLAPPLRCADWQNDWKALDGLPYLDAVCREVLRLHSPAHSIPRACAKDDVIPLGKPLTLRDGSEVNEIRIRAGDDVVIPQKWMNVDPALWGDDANEFKPERWLQDENHRYYVGGLNPVIAGQNHSGWSSLMTFSIGPRNCIGYRMAVAETKVALAFLVAKFEFLQHDGMKDVYGEVQIVDRPRVKGVKGYHMPCWVKPIEN